MVSILLFLPEPGLLLAQQHLIEHWLNGVTCVSIELIHPYREFYAGFSGSPNKTDHSSIE